MLLRREIFRHMRSTVVIKTTSLFLVGSLVAGTGARAQTTNPELGREISLSNGSFEDVPRQAHPPRGWYDCGFPGESKVDVHPAFMAQTGDSVRDTAFFEVDKRAIDGNTYLGMVVRDNDTYEAVSQRFNASPLEAGKCYTFSIYLAQEDRYVSLSKTTTVPVNYNTPAKLRIWGGRSYCDRGELLAESAPVSNQEWLEFDFRFEPKTTLTYIVLEAYYKTPVLFPYNGNLLVDLAGGIVPTPCDELPGEGDEVLAEVEVPTEAEPEPVAEPAEPEPAAPEVAEAETPRPVRTPAVRPPSQEVKLQGLRRSELRTGSVVRVENLYFKADSSTVETESYTTLDDIYDFLNANPDVVIEVGGHTNNIPSAEFCDWLSAERAQAVVDYLVGKGITKARLFPKGYGKRDPIASNKTDAGRRRNQRVEIKVLSIG